MFKKLIVKALSLGVPGLLIAFRNFKENYKLSKEPRIIGKGFKFIGNYAMMSGNFEPGETVIFEKILKQVDVVVNVGANVGYYCCIALNAKKRVIAFEPMPTNIQALLANVHSNHWESKIEIFPMALSDKAGIMEIFGEGTGASLIKGWAGVEAAKTSLIPTSTLDLVLGDRFLNQRCLLMVDIEGSEYLFLEGAKDFLNMSPKPIFFMEISIQAQQPRGQKINPNLLETFEPFWSRGYKAFTTHHSHRLVTREEVQEIVNGGADTLCGDTFLFLHEEAHEKLD